MCGRSRVALGRRQVVAAAGVPESSWRDAERYQPTENVAPGRYTPVVKRDREGNKEVHSQKWGLVPSFNKPDVQPDHFRMFNARSETVEEKGVFKRLLAHQRCVVLLNGFYEWAKEGKEKQPYYIYLHQSDVIKVAGLYDHWQTADGEILYTYTILTTDSSKRLQWLHDRMPVILHDPKDEELWLQTDRPLSTSELAAVSMPYNGEDLVWYPVTKSMGNIRYQGPDCAKELKRQSIANFFAPVGKGKANAAENGGEVPTINADEVPVTSQAQDSVKGDVCTTGGTANEPKLASKLEAAKQLGPEIEAEPFAGPDLCSLQDSGAAQTPAKTKTEAGATDKQQQREHDAAVQAAKSTSDGGRGALHMKRMRTPASVSSQKKAKADAAAAGSSKITSFFAKKPG